MAALGFLMNFAGIALPVSFEIAEAVPKKFLQKTVVVIQLGDGNTTMPLIDGGGNVPHIALWDDNGARIGQYHPKSKDQIKQGEAVTIEVLHKQNGNRVADPNYVMLSQLAHGAICVSSVQVSNGVVSGTFYGNTGHACGQHWFPSSKKLGTTFIAPECVWLDGDHTGGLNAMSMSFHLNDMIPSSDKLDMYASNKDYICKSTPRFSWWGNLLPDGVPPFFNPPLQYGIDSVSGGEGADLNPDLALDATNNIVYDKGVYISQGEARTKRRNNNRPGNISKSMSKRQGSNKDPSHLITTDMVGHSAKVVCEDEMSFGWDIVSLKDRYYCDMVDKVLYQLCGDVVSGNCFDLERKVLVGHGGINARGEASTIGVPTKRYETHGYWEE